MSNFHVPIILVLYPIMRWMLLGIFVFCFVFAPMYLLNAFVMPELTSLKQVYSNTGATASNVSQQITPYEKFPNNL